MLAKNKEGKSFFQKFLGLKTNEEKTKDSMRKKFKEINMLEKQKIKLEEDIIKMAKLEIGKDGKLRPVEAKKEDVPAQPQAQQMPQVPVQPQAPQQSPFDAYDPHFSSQEFVQQPQFIPPQEFVQQSQLTEQQMAKLMNTQQTGEQTIPKVLINLVNGQTIDVEIPFEGVGNFIDDLSKAIDEQSMFILNHKHRLNGRHVIDFVFE